MRWHSGSVPRHRFQPRARTKTHGFEDVHQAESGAEFALGAEIGFGEKARGDVEIENDADFGVVRHLHGFFHGSDGEL